MRVYLLSSLPSLSLDAPAPLGMSELFMRSGDALSTSDMNELEGICGQPPEGTSPFARKWIRTWTILQAWNQKERSDRLPTSERPSITTDDAPDSQFQNDLTAAWSETDPLKREIGLLRAEWNWLESHRRRAPYSSTDLLGYALQLQLLNRKDQWEESAGETLFQDHVRSFLEPVLEDLVPQEHTP